MRRFTIYLLLLLQGACTSGSLLRDKDYEFSQAAYSQGEMKGAIEEFPEKEQSGFITTIEKSWLKFWANEPQAEELIHIAKSIDERKVIKVSREAKTFFLRESADGYIPSEHEVVILHLLASLSFSEKGQWEAARV
jgi:hypothetical protein